MSEGIIGFDVQVVISAVRGGMHQCTVNGNRNLQILIHFSAVELNLQCFTAGQVTDGVDA